MEVVEEGIIVATSIPRKLRGMVVVDGALVGPRGMGIRGGGVVNPTFALLLQPFWHKAREREKWPVRRGGRRG